MKVFYADNNATTRVAPEAIAAMEPYLTELYGNPSSMHTFGGQVGQALEQAREQVAALFGARPTEIVFTSCGTESDNAAIRGALEAYPDKNHIITTRVEHPAVINVCKYLERNGYKVTWLGVDHEGRLDVDELRDSITPNTAMVTVMYANNETGVVFPIEEIAKITKDRGVLFHCDAVQAVGKIPIDLRRLPVDLLSLSGHKIHAPKGVGALYIRRGTKFRPLIMGGHQERNRRGGTENVASIVGLGVACELAAKHLVEENTRVKALRDRMEAALLERIPGAVRTGCAEPRLPNTSNIGFEYVEGEAILLLFSEAGICASSGSACTSGSLEPSHVLRAMGIPFTRAHGSVRLSLSRYTTDEEVEYLIETIPKVIGRLREISPYGKEASQRTATI
jgi:cysteine desulfurase